MTKRKILVMGLPGSGKTSLARELASNLGCVWFNADEVRTHINKDLGFSIKDRSDQANRLCLLCDIVLRSRTNQFVIADFVCPTAATRQIFNPDIIIWLDTIKSSRFADTDALFEAPEFYHIRIDQMDYDIKSILKLIRQLSL